VRCCCRWGGGGINDPAGADALKTSFEQLATSIAAPGVQALAPALAAAAQGVQTFAADIGGLNQNMVALGGGVLAAATAFGAFKALIGAGGSIFGGVALKGSAVALDASAAQLSAAAVALGGGKVAAAGMAASSVGGIARSLLPLTGVGALAAGAIALTPKATADDIGMNEAAPGMSFTNPSRGKSGPHPRNGGLDEAKAKAETLRNMIDSPMDLNINSSSIDDALRKVSQLRSAIDGVNAAMTSKTASIPPRHPPSLGSVQRGNFSYGGVNGE
jgi:hypothetical protein